jgi:hypothetical protein
MAIVAHVPNADRAHKIELQAANVDISMAFRDLSQNNFRNIHPDLVICLPNLRSRALQWSPIRYPHRASPDLQWRLDRPRRDSPDEHGTGMSTFC